MTTLMAYHTSLANTAHYWENNAVATQLKAGIIKTYEEYTKACKQAGCSCYSEDVFNAHLNNTPFN